MFHIKIPSVLSHLSERFSVCQDLILNIIGFIPIGALAGLLIERYRLAKVLLVGLLVSLTIEYSQLIWHRGVFDVNDLFNNAMGALIGGVIAVGVINGTQRHKDAKDNSLRQIEGNEFA